MTSIEEINIELDRVNSELADLDENLDQLEILNIELKKMLCEFKLRALTVKFNTDDSCNK